MILWVGTPNSGKSGKARQHHNYRVVIFELLKEQESFKGSCLERMRKLLHLGYKSSHSAVDMSRITAPLEFLLCSSDRQVALSLVLGTNKMMLRLLTSGKKPKLAGVTPFYLFNYLFFSVETAFKVLA